MYKKRRFFQQAGIVILMSFSTSTLFATDVADESVNSGDLTLSPTASYDSATLRVSSNDADVTHSYNSGEYISMDLSSLPDGLYDYQLVLITHDNDENSDPNIDGQSQANQSGQFRIINTVASVYNDEIAEAEAEAEDEASRLLAEESPEGEVK